MAEAGFNPGPTNSRVPVSAATRWVFPTGGPGKKEAMEDRVQSPGAGVKET